MAAAENVNANVAGESTGTPPNPTAVMASSSVWNKSGLDPEGQRMGVPTPSESLVTAEAPPPPSDAVSKQTGAHAKGGSSPDGSEAETQPEGTANGSKKVAWVKPNNAAVDSGLVMGAVSWPTLSESTKASTKPSSIDTSKNPNDLAISLPQGTTVNAPALLSLPSSATPKLTTSNPNSPNPNSNATQHHVRPARQRPIKREGGGNTSSNGVFSPHSTSPMDTPHANHTPSLRPTSGVSDVSGRDHGHVNVIRDSNYRTGGDHPQQRNYRRNNSGSFNGRRDHDRGNHEWNHHRSFNGRDPVVQPQRGGPRGFIRPPPLHAAAGYIPPPPIRPYVSPDMRPVYYIPPQPGMPYVGQITPPVFYPPVDTQLHAQIVKQIDYYFSNENLVKDIYLRQNMDERGWVPVQLIANFNKVMHLTTDIQLILNAMQGSAIVEVQGDKLRKRNEWMKWIMPSSVQFPTGTASQSPRALQDIIGARVQALVLENNPDKVGADAGTLPKSSSEEKDGSNSTGC